MKATELVTHELCRKHVVNIRLHRTLAHCFAKTPRAYSPFVAMRDSSHSGATTVATIDSGRSSFSNPMQRTSILSNDSEFGSSSKVEGILFDEDTPEVGVGRKASFFTARNDAPTSALRGPAHPSEYRQIMAGDTLPPTSRSFSGLSSWIDKFCSFTGNKAPRKDIYQKRLDRKMNLLDLCERYRVNCEAGATDHSLSNSLEKQIFQLLMGSRRKSYTGELSPVDYFIDVIDRKKWLTEQDCNDPGFGWDYLPADWSSNQNGQSKLASPPSLQSIKAQYWWRKEHAFVAPWAVRKCKFIRVYGYRWVICFIFSQWNLQAQKVITLAWTLAWTSSGAFQMLLPSFYAMMPRFFKHQTVRCV